MSLVNYKLNKPTDEGQAPATGVVVEFKPTAWHANTDIYGNPIGFVLPSSFTVTLDENGEAQVDLEATLDPTWCWRVRELTVAGATNYFMVPNSEEVLDFWIDCPMIDPDTLQPGTQKDAWNSLSQQLLSVNQNVSIYAAQLQALQAEWEGYNPSTINGELAVDGNFNISASDVNAVPTDGSGSEITAMSGGLNVQGEFIAGNANNTIHGNLIIDGMVSGHKVILVLNNTGVTLTKGTVVYISGANGDNVLISKARANTEATSSQTIGVVYENILSGFSGYLLTEGYIEGINTSAAGSAGDPIYLSPDNAGGMVFGLANKPVAPNHLVYLGIVARKHATQGKAFIKIQNGYELQELHNVLIVNPQHGDVLTYDAISGLWKNVGV